MIWCFNNREVTHLKSMEEVLTLLLKVEVIQSGRLLLTVTNLFRDFTLSLEKSDIHSGSTLNESDVLL